MLYTNPQENVLIIGPSGAGKHLFATQRLVNSLADGNSAVVFDCGRSYAHLVRALGGKLVTVDTRRQGTTVETYGTMPLTVYELENIVEAFDIEKLPNLPVLDATTFVLVDELWQMNRRLPGLWEWLQKGSELNAGFCGVMQMLADVNLAAIPERTRLQRIENFAPVETDHLQAGQLVRHQDGGIYRFHSRARHTDDQADLIIYEHVWPFTPDQVWARPAHEWSSRFTPITNEDLREAQKQPRAEAQAAITNAKAMRRAEEARRKATAESDYNMLVFAHRAKECRRTA
ncbi:DUF1653 domain-containing protein [Burkholderia multivorans]|uniref:DUF1653 domain-containing protein n=1 Tax=Burkholderia multivorans TaxID=87883 RepID=UPI001C22D282|nr:DUF1653 domain-containing protein [Burkholderia multivorans]MBU9200271.1 DUF1653 domain-containing protein [Burkholderia multivorans]MDN8078602.1 DUF1653 domain-containing protein [Burkholderia multivorans]